MKTRRDFVKKTTILRVGTTLGANLTFTSRNSKKEKLNVFL